ncbi:hypothetical protein BGM26_06890 [Bacillus sp. FJAT-29790]|uniref:hypothetical protein n=1 Tax=Bacillus sp. FJAT-29790 TaxID=1895002 RepID=UPI001C224031|nr:hypothetical protein [Bacillus sp. FJAT-29790]MBU8878715.1 hypothetical protein [Bacillus sp. FJAT-29790]
MKKWFLLIISSLWLAGCMTKEPQTPQKPMQLQPQAETAKIKDYFPLENKNYFFKGEGNEFAVYNEMFYQKEGDYLPSIVENGGTRIFKVYQLTDDEIFVVYEEPEFYDEMIPALDSVKSKFVPISQLKQPFEVGNSFGDWKIVDVHAKLSLPIGELEDVIITEKKNEDNSLVRNYWVPGYGKVKEEFLMTDKNGQEFTITSLLEKIK